MFEFSKVSRKKANIYFTLVRMASHLVLLVMTFFFCSSNKCIIGFVNIVYYILVRKFAQLVKIIQNCLGHI